MVPCDARADFDEQLALAYREIEANPDSVQVGRRRRPESIIF
jgi:hypothetical protein